MKNLASILTIIVLAANVAFAEKMDIDANNVVIEKLEKSLSLEDKETIKYTSLVKRIGDLYSERARLKFMSEQEQSCNGCKGSITDRAMALKYYNRIYKKLKGQERLDVELQRAELYLLLNKVKNSIAAYNSLLNFSRSVRNSKFEGVALYGLGEIRFTKAQYKRTAKLFKKAIRLAPKSLRPMAYYRLAWSQMNLGKTTRAIQTLTKILKTPALLSKNGQYNEPFHEDISKDLVIFLAQKGVSQSDINVVENYSPSQIKQNNVYSLAVEAQRTGQFLSAYKVWMHYLKFYDVNKLEQLKIQVKLAQIHYNMNKKRSAMNAYKKALNLWKQVDCDDECGAIKVQIKNFIVHWKKELKDKKDPQFYTALDSYLKVFDEDASVYFIAATQAYKNRKFADASEYFRKSAKTAKKDKKLKLTALFEMVSSAEKTNNKNIKRSAYKTYLEMDKVSSRRFEIDYQHVYLDYEDKNFKSSFHGFTRLAETTKTPKSIRLKSADLALDSLAALKRQVDLEKKALVYSSLFKNRRPEYLKVARSACFNQANIRVNEAKTSNSDLNTSLKCLRKYSFKDLSGRQKFAYYKVMMAISMKLLKFNEVDRVASKILSIKGVNSYEKDFALSKIVFVAELQLKFNKAYRNYKKIGNKGISKAESELKLGMLAELAGKNPVKHYEKFVKLTPSLDKANKIRVHMALTSRLAWKKLISFEKKLSRTPEIFADAALELFGKYQNLSRARQVLAHRRVKRTYKGSLLNRSVMLLEMNSSHKKLMKHKVSSYNQYVLNKTLTQRIALLSKVEANLKSAINAKDILVQAHVLSILGEEYKRFAERLGQLKPPRGLNKNETAIYQRTMNEKIKGYKTRQFDIARTEKKLWEQKNIQKEVFDFYKLATVNQRKVVDRQLGIISTTAPTKVKRFVNFKFSKVSKKSTAVSSLWKSIRQNPLETKTVQKLKDTMKAINNSTLQSYMDLRLHQIKGVAQ